MDTNTYRAFVFQYTLNTEITFGILTLKYMMSS